MQNLKDTFSALKGKTNLKNYELKGSFTLQRRRKQQS